MKIGAIAFMAASLAATAPAVAEKLETTATHTYNNGAYGTIDATNFVTLTAGWYKLSLKLQGYNTVFSSVSALLVEKTTGAAIANATTGVTGSVPQNTQTTLFQLLTAGKYGISFTGGAWGNSATANATLTNVTPVPGPEAGAGLGALALGGLALYMKRRQKEELAA